VQYSLSAPIVSRLGEKQKLGLLLVGGRQANNLLDGSVILGVES
jgi:hypothetical protein